MTGLPRFLHTLKLLWHIPMFKIFEVRSCQILSYCLFLWFQILNLVLEFSYKNWFKKNTYYSFKFYSSFFFSTSSSESYSRLLHKISVVSIISYHYNCVFILVDLKVLCLLWCFFILISYIFPTVYFRKPFLTSVIYYINWKPPFYFNRGMKIVRCRTKSVDLLIYQLVRIINSFFFLWYCLVLLSYLLILN